MSDFRIVDDSLRTVARRPEYDAIASGKTVFVPANGEPLTRIGNRIRTAMSYQGHKNLRTRTLEVEGVVGVLAWLESES